MSEQTENRTNIISGPITKTVITLAVPVTLGMFFEFALSVTDFFWVGKLGPAAQDSITSSMVVIWSFFASVATISIGVTALVSRCIGANEKERASHYIRQGLWLGIILGLLLLVVGYLLSPKLLQFMDASAETSANAIPYLRFFFLATPAFALIEILYASYRASGDTRTPMKVAILVICCNMILDPVLIFGLGPFPALGVPGAGLSTLISIIAGLIMILILSKRGKLGYRIGSLAADHPKLASIFKIVRIGAPIATQQLIFVGVYWFLIRIVHQFGEEAGAAMGIGNRMESFAYLTTYGLSLAASTMVGQNLGAGNPDRAARCAWVTIGFGSLLAFAISLAFLIIPGTIASIFTSNPTVSEMAVDYLIILGLSQVTMAIEIILEGAFSGSGDTLPVMIVLIPGAVIRIPLAYYLAFNLGWGLSGVWWTLTITTTVKAAILAFWFHRGNWKRKKL